jgi:hypothetical protein
LELVGRARRAIVEGRYAAFVAETRRGWERAPKNEGENEVAS